MESPDSRLIDFDGAKVVYQSSGTGEEALVFIHGWTCDKSLWENQAPLFNKYRSLLIDLPGHGQSDNPRIEYSQELFARSVEAVLVAEGVQRAVLIGHSMGGPVSTMILRLFPAKVIGIIYVDSFFNLPEHYLTDVERKELAIRHSDDAKFEALIHVFFSPHTTEAVRKHILTVMTTTAKHVRCNATTTSCLPHALRYDNVFQIPALHLVTPMFADIDKHWLHHLPMLQTEIWTGYGHFLFMEDAPRFNDRVETFLKAHKLLIL
ncbi:hypothetical protein H2200_013284 [Cladophialophora chaetospira]|uniref:AB hydrolase-1 domain-containing protein n=1 Tax=Cladophialophora chaetospira TaxID=386627 RepID=A0AA38TXU2_9EURO|nr:hypothetical protein H2200_013284 [Cladophialophora chaetospira]